MLWPVSDQAGNLWEVCFAEKGTLRTGKHGGGDSVSKMFVSLPEIHVKMLGMVKDACHPNSREAGGRRIPKVH